MKLYDAPDLGADLATAAGDVLPYVGAGVASGLAIGLIFLGIRRGLAWFRAGAEVRAYDRPLGTARINNGGGRRAKEW